MAQVINFVGKSTPKTIFTKADFNRFSLNPKTGVLRLEFGSKPPVAAAMQTPIEVELDVVVDVQPDLSRAFIEYMVKLAKAIGVDFDAVLAAAPLQPDAQGAAGQSPDRKKQH